MEPKNFKAKCGFKQSLKGKGLSTVVDIVCSEMIMCFGGLRERDIDIGVIRKYEFKSLNILIIKICL